ncbi:MAG: MmcQ/YjbR family DNA-binding protein [Reyranella sp.]|nr:MmcQ/YjbR family DNA-binding protein [Reyranella sp.]
MLKSKRRPEVPKTVLARLRKACLALPETREEQAWVGTRWCVRQETFAHVLMIADGWPPVYARAAGTDGPVCVLTFQSLGPRVDPETFSQAPYFRPRWRPDIVGRVLDSDADWADIAKLLTASYCLLAPKKLSEAVRSGQAADRETRSQRKKRQ